MAERAPLHEAIADCPEGGVCVWVRADDGHRLRVASWRPDGAARGTVLIFSGRTEYIEKYGALATDLGTSGYATAVIDWRGQGLSERLLPDPLPGHVLRFSDYQSDVRALLNHVRSEGLPEPLHLIAHSMGGAIGLRSLMEGLPVKRAVFSAPMWGISLSPRIKTAAWVLSLTARRLGFSHRYAPGGAGRSYPAIVPFEDNLLTTDPTQYARMMTQIETVPELALGGPSLGWLAEALVECRRLSRRAAPDVPCLTLLGGDEAIVDPDRVHSRISGWAGAQLKMLPGGRHECLMERPDLRKPALAAILTHLKG